METRNFFVRLSCFLRGNLISQASLVRTRISGRSDRFDCQDAPAGRRNKSVDIELTSFHLFSLPIHTLAHRNVHVFFVRTYNKLKSHHPRDFHAITRASSLRRGQRSCEVSDSPTCPMYPRNDEIMTKDTANHLSISFIHYIYTQRGK